MRVTWSSNKPHCRIAIVDDHEMFINGLASLLQSESNLDLVATGHSGEDAISIIKEKSSQIDLLLMDVSMPGMDGIEACTVLRKQWPTLKVILLTQFGQLGIVSRAMDADAHGYILKSSSHTELIEAITSVMNGNKVFPAMQSILNVPAGSNAATVKLTKREMEILKLIACEELTSAQIAQRLYIEVRTVEAHRQNMLEKLGVRSTVGLVKFAMSNGMCESNKA